MAPPDIKFVIAFVSSEKMKIERERNGANKQAIVLTIHVSTNHDTGPFKPNYTIQIK